MVEMPVMMRRESTCGPFHGATTVQLELVLANYDSLTKKQKGLCMKYLLPCFALVPTLAWSAPFDGTWTVAQDSMKITGKPQTYLLVGGMFTCGPCTPPYDVKADGSDHKVAGHAYYDNVSVSVLDANTIEIKTRMGDKPWGERKLSVSADGKVLTEEWVIHDAATPHTGKDSYTRVAPPPAGAASISGSWNENTAASSIPGDYLTVTYSETADGLKMTTATGQSFVAKFDGKQVVTEGDPGKTMVALKRIDAHTIEETDRRKGQITDVIVTKISADGKTMRISDRDPIHGTTTTYTATKQ